MRKIDVISMRKIKAAVPRIEEKIKVKISFGKTWIVVKGSEPNEFITEKIVRAVDFGFDIEDALLLLNEDFNLEFIDIKEHTSRKNMKDIRGRLIGTDGKARRTIEKLTGAIIVIKNNDVGVIVDSKHLEACMQGIESLIHGAKHGNVFSYLEKQGSDRLKKYDPDDLGLRDDIPEEDIDEVLGEEFDEDDDEEIG